MKLRYEVYFGIAKGTFSWGQGIHKIPHGGVGCF